MSSIFYTRNPELVAMYKNNFAWLEVYVAALLAQQTKLGKEHPDNSDDDVGLHYFLHNSISGTPSQEHIIACAVAQSFAALNAAKTEVGRRQADFSAIQGASRSSGTDQNYRGIYT